MTLSNGRYDHKERKEGIETMSPVKWKSPDKTVKSSNFLPEGKHYYEIFYLDNFKPTKPLDLFPP